jgi:hypothetical protein
LICVRAYCARRAHDVSRRFNDSKVTWSDVLSSSATDGLWYEIVAHDNKYISDTRVVSRQVDEH